MRDARLNAVVVMTADTRNLHGQLAFVWKHLLPAFLDRAFPEEKCNQVGGIFSGVGSFHAVKGMASMVKRAGYQIRFAPRSDNAVSGDGIVRSPRMAWAAIKRSNGSGCVSFSSPLRNGLGWEIGNTLS